MIIQNLNRCLLKMKINCLKVSFFALTKYSKNHFVLNSSLI